LSLPEIVCHRGANELAPENTYASAQICIDWGMDYLELDINTSRDGVMYVFHGPDLARTTNGQGRIFDLTSHEVDQLDCGAWFDEAFIGTRIPRLEEFLDWIDHRIKLFFDVKWAPLPELVSLIKQQQLERECFFWFGRDKLAKQFVELQSGLAIKINAGSIAAVDEAIHQYGATIIECSLSEATPELVAHCKSRGVKSMVLHKRNEPQAFRQIIAAGVDMVNVDHGDSFLQVINEI
jgi:glycerophosphoryl diester phosphodiesterase